MRTDPNREERLHVLVNNAGIGTTVSGGGRRMVSEDATSCASPSTTSRGTR